MVIIHTRARGNFSRWRSGCSDGFTVHTYLQILMCMRTFIVQLFVKKVKIKIKRKLLWKTPQTNGEVPRPVQVGKMPERKDR